MHDGGPGTRWLATLAGGFLFTLIGVSDAVPGEWETIRESYENALKANEKGSRRSRRRSAGFRISSSVRTRSRGTRSPRCVPR